MREFWPDDFTVKGCHDFLVMWSLAATVHNPPSPGIIRENGGYPRGTLPFFNLLYTLLDSYFKGGDDMVECVEAAKVIILPEVEANKRRLEAAEAARQLAKQESDILAKHALNQVKRDIAKATSKPSDPEPELPGAPETDLELLRMEIKAEDDAQRALEAANAKAVEELNAEIAKQEKAEADEESKRKDEANRKCVHCGKLDCTQAMCIYKTHEANGHFKARAWNKMQEVQPFHRSLPATAESAAVTNRTSEYVCNPSADKPVFNPVVKRKGKEEQGIDRYKRPGYFERRKLRAQPLPASDELVFKLKLEAAFRPRTPELFLQLKNKAVRYLEQFDTTQLTQRALYNLVVNAVGEAMTIGQEEANVRQALKNSEQLRETHKQSAMLKTGALGKMGILRREAALPTTN